MVWMVVELQLLVVVVLLEVAADGVGLGLLAKAFVRKFHSTENNKPRHHSKHLERWRGRCSFFRNALLHHHLPDRAVAQAQDVQTALQIIKTTAI